ncbi:MAG: hypothetical protein WDW36_010084 [Sanguina aurantia]
MMTFSLSLLLVFKITQSFNRFHEGRLLWGQTIALTRSFLQQVLIWLPPETCLLLGPMATRWTIASMFVMKAHISKGGEKLTELHGVLDPHELAYLAAWGNRPLGVAHVWTWIVQESGMHPQLRTNLQLLVSDYLLKVAGCERILKTPLPVAFQRLTSRFLMLYLVGAPVVLWPATGWATLVVAPFLAFLLVGVENSGVQIEQVFNVLPLEAMCVAVKKDCRELEGRFMDTVGAAMQHPNYQQQRPQTSPEHTLCSLSCGSASAASASKCCSHSCSCEDMVKQGSGGSGSASMAKHCQAVPVRPQQPQQQQHGDQSLAHVQGPTLPGRQADIAAAPPTALCIDMPGATV